MNTKTKLTPLARKEKSARVEKNFMNKLLKN